MNKSNMGSRRWFINSAVVASTSVLGGCLSFGTSSPQTVKISELILANQVSEPMHVDILLVDNEEVKFWERLDIRANNPPSSSVPGKKIEGIPADNGEYEMIAKIVETGKIARQNVVSCSDEGQNCVRIRVQIGTKINPDADDPSLLISCDDCTTTQS